ncbi:hypothetical protein [Pseudohalioglobus lutimaris]|uniref:Glycosyltransferase RgtA/B/C/D-like domain-containing protein n=1 Tax=Pseudohalioglobus lutimaris TaxID=1737061 RepID=A0A2N5X6Y9_9GAMM|nr:hypothetical protein [Pseudohalioglobus lutimaris]PLW70240.1 hypothetical protein C0039_03260 [Pseudohalioglobus lutimaris]
MSEPAISISGLALAILLPWLAGISGALLLIPKGIPGRIPVVAGMGYFLGAWFSTLAIRGVDALGIPLSFAMVATVLAGFGLVLALFAVDRTPRQVPYTTPEDSVSITGKLLIALLFLLMGWRYFTILGIVIEQPLFGWDAMMNWAPKAVVWFHQGELTEFVNPSTWLQHGNAAEPYTLGNPPASEYPEMVPLIFLWHMLGAGTWDHPLLQLPWLLAGLSTGLALYGFLRMRRVPTLLSAGACYLLLSLPFLNIHAVIAGYADLWLASAFSIGAIALHLREQQPAPGVTLIVLLMALICIQLKNPGIILGLILLLGTIRQWLKLSWKTESVIILAGAGLVAYCVIMGVRVEVPGLGLVNVGTAGFQLGRFVVYDFQFHPEVTTPVLRSLYSMGNWNLLWYLVTAGILWRLRNAIHWRRPGTLGLILTGIFVFYFVVFFVSSYHYHAITYITLNRAILYVIPALLFWVFTFCTPEEVRDS